MMTASVVWMAGMMTATVVDGWNDDCDCCGWLE